MKFANLFSALVVALAAVAVHDTTHTQNVAQGLKALNDNKFDEAANRFVEASRRASRMVRFISAA